MYIADSGVWCHTNTCIQLAYIKFQMISLPWLVQDALWQAQSAPPFHAYNAWRLEVPNLPAQSVPAMPWTLTRSLHTTQHRVHCLSKYRPIVTMKRHTLAFLYRCKRVRSLMFKWHQRARTAGRKNRREEDTVTSKKMDRWRKGLVKEISGRMWLARDRQQWKILYVRLSPTLGNEDGIKEEEEYATLPDALNKCFKKNFYVVAGIIWKHHYISFHTPSSCQIYQRKLFFWGETVGVR